MFKLLLLLVLNLCLASEDSGGDPISLEEIAPTQEVDGDLLDTDGDLLDTDSDSTEETTPPDTDGETAVGYQGFNDPRWKLENVYGPVNNYVAVYLARHDCRKMITYQKYAAYIVDRKNPSGWSFGSRVTSNYNYHSRVMLRMKPLKCNTLTRCNGHGSRPPHYKPHVEVKVKIHYHHNLPTVEKLVTFTLEASYCNSEEGHVLQHYGGFYAIKSVEVAARCKYSEMDLQLTPQWNVAPKYANSGTISQSVTAGWSKSQEISTTKGREISVEASVGVEFKAFSASATIASTWYSETTLSSSSSINRERGYSTGKECFLKGKHDFNWWEFGYMGEWKGNVKPAGVTSPIYYHSGYLRCTYPYVSPCCHRNYCETAETSQCGRCLSWKQAFKMSPARGKYCLSGAETSIGDLTMESKIGSTDPEEEFEEEEEEVLTSTTEAVKQCSNCQECGWNAEDKEGQEFVDSGELSLEECYRECVIRGYGCRYFAYASAGKHCHLFASCDGKNNQNPTSWDRYRVGKPKCGTSENSESAQITKSAELEVGSSAGELVTEDSFSFERVALVFLAGSFAAYVYANRRSKQPVNHPLLEEEL